MSSETNNSFGLFFGKEGVEDKLVLSKHFKIGEEITIPVFDDAIIAYDEKGEADRVETKVRRYVATNKINKITFFRRIS